MGINFEILHLNIFSDFSAGCPRNFMSCPLVFVNVATNYIFICKIFCPALR